MKKSEWTLIDYLLVMAILAILAEMIVPVVTRLRANWVSQTIAIKIEQGQPVSEEEFKRLEKSHIARRIIPGCKNPKKMLGLERNAKYLVVSVYFNDPETGKLAYEVLAFKQPTDFSDDAAAKVLNIKQGRMYYGPDYWNLDQPDKWPTIGGKSLSYKAIHYLNPE